MARKIIDTYPVFTVTVGADAPRFRSQLMTREQALDREFREELGCGVTMTGPWTVFENIYRHEGALGHEIVFAADIRLHDAALYDRDVIRFSEDDGTACTARWLRPAALPDGATLFPDGLAAALSRRPER